MNNTLYDTDFYLWIDQQANYLKKQDILNLDWQNLTEELESLGREQKHKVDSYLKQVLIHLLLYKYWNTEKDYCAAGWEEEITNFRDELEWLLESRSLYNYCIEKMEIIYLKARQRVIKKTGLPPSLIPLECPFEFSQIFDVNYLPND